MIHENYIKTRLEHFNGSIYQEPPCFSALKLNGIPLYKYAGQDIRVKLSKRNVFINSTKLISFKNNIINIRVECGKGVYIRSLARDIAKELGTVGHLIKLIRTNLGIYNKSNSIKISEFNKWLFSKI